MEKRKEYIKGSLYKISEPNRYRVDYEKAYREGKYKVSSVDFEYAYPNAGIDISKYSDEEATDSIRFTDAWWCGWWMKDGYMYIHDVDELIWDGLTPEDKDKLREYLKKLLIKV